SILFAAFFFSSRRRHTKSKRDWRSDVCSSDLTRPASAQWTITNAHIYENQLELMKGQLQREPYPSPSLEINPDIQSLKDLETWRSEERRVGNQRRTGRTTEHGIRTKEDSNTEQ